MNKLLAHSYCKFIYRSTERGIDKYLLSNNVVFFVNTAMQLGPMIVINSFYMRHDFHPSRAEYKYFLLSEWNH